MSSERVDMLILALQLLYVFGGLVLISYLTYKIVKNQVIVRGKKRRHQRAFDAALAAQLAVQQSQEEMFARPSVRKPTIAHQHGIYPMNRDAHKNVTGSGIARPGSPSPYRPQHARKGVAAKGKQNRYSNAASLAARGFSINTIRQQVGLPRCEIDLIAKLNCQYSQFHWEARQPLLDAIESGT